MFQPSELRRFLRHRDDYAVLCDGLPGEEASSNVVTDAAIQGLARHGLITRRLFDELLEERPYRRDEIERVAAIWGALADSEQFLRPEEYRDGPLKFANIAIDASDENWRELVGNPLEQRFELIHDADPLFDITVLNIGKSPTILTAIGIQVVTVWRIDFRGIPMAGKIRKSDSYVLPIPRIAQRMHERLGHEYGPQDIRETIVEKIPDPVYLEPNAPYRYGLILKGYCKNIPNRAQIRMLAVTDQGESWSGELALNGSTRAPVD